MKEFLKGYRRKIYGSDIAKRIAFSQKNVALILLDMEREGILISEQSGNRKYYSVNFSNPLIEDYLILFEVLRKIEFLEKNKNLIDFSNGVKGEIVCVFGSYAKDTQKKNSDLDLFVVGKIDAVKLKKSGEKYGYDVQIFNMSFQDFKKSLNKSNIIKEVIENHVILKGKEFFIKEVSNE